eukprot:707370-Pyramimonas_sp.AAC.1
MPSEPLGGSAGKDASRLIDILDPVVLPPLIEGASGLGQLRPPLPPAAPLAGRRGGSGATAFRAARRPSPQARCSPSLIGHPFPP